MAEPFDLGLGADLGLSIEADEPAREIHPLDPDEVSSILKAEIASSIGSFPGTTSDISDQRAQALRDYYGQSFGATEPGYSGVVLRDLADTIEWILPSLMRLFFGGRYTGIYLPSTEEETAFAEQATERVNSILQTENRGFLLFHNWFKDALIEKNGFLKVWYERTEVPHYETLCDLSEEEMTVALQTLPPDAKVISYEGRLDGEKDGRPERETHSITVKRLETRGRLRMAGIAPEDFLIAADALTLEDASFAGHRRVLSYSDLREMGVSTSKIDKLAPYHGMAGAWNEEAQARRQDDQSFGTGAPHRQDWAGQRTEVLESIVRIDEDGDGFSELRKILSSVDGATILLDEPVQETCFLSLTPIPMPHKFFGRSMHDLVADLQYIRSEVLRQILNNFYLTNHGRYEVVEDQVNLDDLLTVRPGGYVRTQTPGMIKALETAPLGPIAFNLLEYLQEQRENRTGITRYTQGLDSDALNKTATGVTEIMNAAQQRIELVARLFAETGVTELFQKALSLLVRHEHTLTTLRVRGDWMQVAPMQWNPQMQVKVEVGIGSGNAAARAMGMQQLLGVQQQLAQSPYGGLVSQQNVYNAVSRMTELMGFTVPEQFFTNPHGQEPPPPPPDPKSVLLEAQAQQTAAETAQLEEELRIKDKQIMGQIEMERMRTTSYSQTEQERIASQERIAAAKLGVDKGELAVKAFTAEKGEKGEKK